MMKTGRVFDQPATVPLEHVRAWFDAMGSAPSHDSPHTRIGVQLEATGEMLATLGNAAATPSVRQTISLAADVLTFVQRRFKEGTLEVSLGALDRTALRDALCAQIATAVGVAEILGLDIAGAFREVVEAKTISVEGEV